jgi:hypothetical protein
MTGNQSNHTNREIALFSEDYHGELAKTTLFVEVVLTTNFALMICLPQRHR